MEIDAFQQLMADTYGTRDRDRGIAATIAWLTEELGELAQATRKGTPAQQLHELGDVLAWLASLADQLNLSLAKAATRYAQGCPRCGEQPCNCGAEGTSRSPTLVVIVGPIASGKSSVSIALGARFRAAGRQVAVLDLDETVAEIGGFQNLSEQQFRLAQTVFGQQVGTWLRKGIDVIAHGPFFQRHEDAALLHAVAEGVDIRRVLLQASYESAVGRVAEDADRILSNDSAILRQTYDRVEQLLPAMPASEWRFDTDTITFQEIVDELAEALLKSSPGHAAEQNSGHQSH